MILETTILNDTILNSNRHSIRLNSIEQNAIGLNFKIDENWSDLGQNDFGLVHEI